MSGAEAAREAAVLKGMIEVEAGIVPTLVMTYPLTGGMNVRGFGVTFLVAKTTGFGRGVLGWRSVLGWGGMLGRRGVLRGRCSLDWGRSSRWNIPAANLTMLLTTVPGLVLRQSAGRENQQYPQTASNYLFHICSETEILRADR
jgi:hypothetical protein